MLTRPDPTPADELEALAAEVRRLLTGASVTRNCTVKHARRQRALCRSELPPQTAVAGFTESYRGGILNHNQQLREVECSDNPRKGGGRQAPVVEKF